MRGHYSLALIIAAALAWPVAAQNTIAWDTSGNSMLTGQYYFRQVVYQAVGSTGSVGQSSALYGTINFDGKGAYSITAQLADSKTSSGQPQPFTVTGTYGISASGFGYIDNPLFTNDSVIGSVAQGVFVGSATETLEYRNDAFVAIPAGASPATVATFQGKYWLGYMDVPAGNTLQAKDALFPITANGAGGFTGTVTANGYIGTSSTAVNQAIGNLSVSFANGVGTLVFPAAGAANATLISGSKVLYVSGDGNFAVGGSASGYDLIFALRAPTGSVSNSLYQGLYYFAGLDNYNETGAVWMGSYYGALTASGSGVILRDDRELYSDSDSGSYDFNYEAAPYNLAGDGAYDLSAYRYAIGAGGIGFAGIGKGPTLGLSFGVKAPTFSGSGVYLNPTGVVNAASSAPFTGGVAPGELITLYGSGLAGSTVVAAALPFPTTLGNVQVSINGRPAPIYYVSPTQISVIVPYETELTYAAIQVTNNGTKSNKVTVFAIDAAPGIFSVPPGGIGYAAALHADYSLVSKANPATKGETIQVFLTGLGAVNPSAAAGSAAPTNPLSTTTGQFYVYIDNQDATTSYVGLAPGLAGLYQINVTVPTTASSGDVYLDIQADSNGFYTSQVIIPVK